MKRRSQWFIAFLTLFGLAVPSFSTYSDVNALKFDLEYIPFTQPIQAANNGMILHEPFQFLGSTSSGDTSRLRDIGWVIVPTYNSDTGRCVYSTYQSATPQPWIHQIQYRIQPPDDYNGPTPPDFTHCYTDTALAPSDVTSLFSTIPRVATQAPQILHSYSPYRFYYNGAYIRSTQSQDGLERSSRLEFSDLFQENQFPSTVKSLHIPIGISTQTFVPGDHLEFSGSFYFDSSDSPSTFTLNPNYNARIQAKFSDFDNYFDQHGASYQPSSNSCSLTYTSNSDSSQSPHILSYSCSIDVPSGLSSYNLSGFTLLFDGPGSNYLWTLPNADWMVYDSSTVISNYDDTPATTSFQDFQILGNAPRDEIPGAVGSLPVSGSCADGDWLCSLSKLFNFNIINPFTPIFGLFANNEACTQIPIIAGMIHSDEQTVCPWFDSSTRNIVTPVLGIASMMLLFGFAVRWLGARSGNFFEDSTGEVVGLHSSLNNGWGRRGK